MWIHSVLPPAPPSLASLVSTFVLPLHTRFPFFPFFVVFFYSNEAAFRPFRKQIHKKKCSAVPPRHILIPLFFLHEFSFRRRTLLARRRKQQQQFLSVLLLLLLSVFLSVQLAAYSLFSKLHLLLLPFFFVIHVPCHTWCCAAHSLRVFLTSLCSFIVIIFFTDIPLLFS